MSKLRDSISSLEQSLGYVFEDPSLLNRALTHCSAGRDNNERLEFLGDSFLNLTISSWLFKNTAMSEGQLSIARSTLVSKKQLVVYARPLRLLESLEIKNTQVSKESRNIDSFIADAFEALWGAIFLDQGFEKTEKLFLSQYEKTIQDALESASHKDPKTLLQEISQKHFKRLPHYELIQKEGQGHNLKFKVLCHLGPFKEVAYGQSIKLAQVEAAKKVLKAMDK